MNEKRLRSRYLARKAPRGRWVIAHRGWSRSYPENTLAAFRAGVEIGADAIELDVHLTRDAHVIVMHDAKIDRTTDGTGRIADLTLTEMESLDAGAWKGAAFAGERVPTLAAVLREIALPVMIEVKPEGDDVVRRTIDVVRAADAAARVVIASFHEANLRTAREAAPEIERLALGGPDVRTVLELAHIGAPDHRSLTGKLVNDLHRNDRAVWTWTVDEPADIERAIRLGVDGMISNMPERVVSAVTGSSD